jgi:hypothetical protein
MVKVRWSDVAIINSRDGDDISDADPDFDPLGVGKLL